MPEMVLPGVYIDVRAEGLISPGRVTVGNLGVVGTASKGPIGKPVLLADYSEAVDVFGNYDAWVDGKSKELSLVRALELAFGNGATTVFAVRTSSTEAGASGDDFIPEFGKLTKAKKASYAVKSASGSAAVLKAKTHGTWGNDIQINVFDAEENSLVVGESHTVVLPVNISLKRKPIVENSGANRVFIDVKATGQTLTPAVVHVAPAAGQVQINVADGKLTFGDTLAADDVVRVNYAVPAAESRKVTIRYGAVTEVYTAADGNHLVAQINDADSPSTLVSASAGTAGTEKPDKFAKSADEGLFEKFGAGANTPGSDGADAEDTDYEAGMNQLFDELVHIVVAAGMPADKIGSELAKHCAKASTDLMKADRIAVVGSGLKTGAQFDQIRNHTADSDRVIFVAPGIKTTDAASGKPVELPGAYTAAVIAGMLSGVQAHISLTNKPVAVEGLETRFSQPQLTQLVQARVLAVEEQRGRGIRVVKGITTSTDSAFAQITTRRIVDFAKYGVRSAASPYIGKLNNERVRAAMKATITSFLNEMLEDEMLIAFEAEVTATREEQIKGIARVTIVLQPTFSIDFVKVTMILQ